VTDGRTDIILIAIPRLHYMQRGKNQEQVARHIDFAAVQLKLMDGRWRVTREQEGKERKTFVCTIYSACIQSRQDFGIV